MKSEIHEKFDIYHKIVFNERYELFFEDNAINIDRFIIFIDNIRRIHDEMKLSFRYFKNRRSQMIKKFTFGKYMILLRSRFCTDICTIIIKFIL